MKTLFGLIYFFVGILFVGIASGFLVFWVIAIILVEGLFLKLTKWSKKYEYLLKRGA